MPTPNELTPLVRETCPPRRHAAQTIAVSAAALALLGAVAVAAVRYWPVHVVAPPSPAPAPVTQTYSLSVPVSVEMHQTLALPTPAATEPRRPAAPCPAPDRLSDRAIGPRYGEPTGDDEYQLTNVRLEGVTASPNRHGVLATWSDKTILRSDDSGRTFAPVLASPGKVFSVRIDCHDNLYALAAPNWFGQRSPDGEESWRELSFIMPTEEYQDSAKLAVGAGFVGVFQMDYNSKVTVALSPDGGVTWSFRQLQSSLMETMKHVAIDAGGRVTVATSLGDCMWNGFAVHAFDAPSGELSDIGDMSGDLLGVGHDGWAYTEYDCTELLCAYAPGRARKREVAGVAEPSVNRYYTYVVSGPDHSYAVVDSIVHRLNKGRAVRIADDLPNTVSFSTADAGGRLLGIGETGELLRWSRRHGLRVLRGARTSSLGD